MKLGSLFDGSGGFPLAGHLCGITPAFASEVEPYPIAVTTSRFPAMKHLGSVTDINGAEIEPVNIITFGSPCQDLSVAGKRAGLKHEANGDEETTRSGLFMEAVRIIKEMRRATHGAYPDFAIWENVPGAFSSNGGDDFRVVLEELIKIVEPGASVPSPEKGRWPYADAYVGDGWSLAYRTLDAQYWGVPQRRRRIYLVLDLRGERAHKVLFEREGLRGYFETGRAPWQGAASDAESSVGADDRAGKCVIAVDQGGGKSGANFHHDLSPTLTCTHGGEPAIAYTLKIRSGCEGGGKGALIQTDKSATLSTLNDQYLFQPVTLEPGIAQREGGHIYEGVSGTLRANAGDNQMAVAYAGMVLDDQGGQQISVRTDGKSPTLRAEMHGNVPCVMEAAECIKEQHLFENHSQDTRYKGPLDVSPIVSATFGMGGNNQPFVVEETPVYCLQGNGIDRPAVVYAVGNGQLNQITMAEQANTLDCMHDQQAVVYREEPPIAIDRAAFNQGQNAQYAPQYYTDGTVPTLVAKGPSGVAYSMKSISRSGKPLEEQANPICASDYKDPDIVAYPPNGIRYIVRRLTPTECARLQGFPDTWGHPNPKETLTDAEFQFWHEVRNTHAAINGKQLKQYTKDQMLKWYNSLHTDSAEYKMWGNGIALPTALYVMQGIADALKEEQETAEPQPTITNETQTVETMENTETAEEEKDYTMEKLSTIQKRENLNVVYRYGEPGPGGAYHDYDIYRAEWPHTHETALACIEFQKGPRKDPDARHGVLDSDLLEIVRDRLAAFQSGPNACRENEKALMHVEEALMWMNRRVEDRIERQVLGTMEK